MDVANWIVDFIPLLGVPLGELLPPAASSTPLPLPSIQALRAQIDPVDVQGGYWLSDPNAKLFLGPEVDLKNNRKAQNNSMHFSVTVSTRLKSCVTS